MHILPLFHFHVQNMEVKIRFVWGTVHSVKLIIFHTKWGRMICWTRELVKFLWRNNNESLSSLATSNQIYMCVYIYVLFWRSLKLNDQQATINAWNVDLDACAAFPKIIEQFCSVE